MVALATPSRTDAVVVADHCRGDCRVVEEGAGGSRSVTLMTPAEVAGMLRVKLPRIYEAVKTRRLRAVRIGRLLRFRLRDVELFLERYTTGTR